MSIFNKNSEAIFNTILNISDVKYYSFFSRMHICITNKESSVNNYFMNICTSDRIYIVIYKYKMPNQLIYLNIIKKQVIFKLLLWTNIYMKRTNLLKYLKM